MKNKIKVNILLYQSEPYYEYIDCEVPAYNNNNE